MLTFLSQFNLKHIEMVALIATVIFASVLFTSSHASTVFIADVALFTVAMVAFNLFARNEVPDHPFRKYINAINVFAIINITVTTTLYNTGLVDTMMGNIYMDLSVMALTGLYMRLRLEKNPSMINT